MLPKRRFKADDGSQFPDWEEKKLSNYLSFKNGLNADKDKFGTGIKYISVLDILNNDFITYEKINGKVNVDKETLNEFSVEYGDVLFQRSSETKIDAGKSNVYLDKENIATFGGFVIRGKKIGTYEPRYMNYCLKSENIRRQIMSKAQGEQHVNVGQETLANIRIFMPSFDEQKKIADFLSDIDNMISMQEQQLANLEEQKKGIMQKIFSQEVRFKDDNGNEYPEWKEKRLANCFCERREKAVGNEELLSVTKSNGIIRQSESTKRDISNENKSNYKKVHKGDIAYNSMRMWQGAEGVSSYDGIVSPAYTILIPQNVCGKYFEYLFKMPEQMYLFERFSTGLTSDTWNLKYPQFSKLKVTIPCFEEQKKIAVFLSDYDKAIEIKRKKIEEWKTLKKGLIQQMFV